MAVSPRPLQSTSILSELQIHSEGQERKEEAAHKDSEQTKRDPCAHPEEKRQLGSRILLSRTLIAGRFHFTLVSLRWTLLAGVFPSGGLTNR